MTNNFMLCYNINNSGSQNAKDIQTYRDHLLYNEFIYQTTDTPLHLKDLQQKSLRIIHFLQIELFN